MTNLPKLVEAVKLGILPKFATTITVSVQVVLGLPGDWYYW